MTEPSSRRAFLKTSAASAVATSILLPGAYAAGGNEVLRIGLVGCGGRGSGAAREALRADPNVKLVAMCDAFSDRLQTSLDNLKKIKDIAGKIDVTPDRCFDGFDGYKKLLDCGVDVVLLTTPPGFRPIHLRAAVEAGKHVFCEKPVAVDAPGIRSVIESAKLAKEKGTGLCSGYCYRYDRAKRETVKRIHDGEIGDVVAMNITYHTGPIWWRGEDPKWTPMDYQMRNWYYFSWLSGDFIVEQHCHNFDKANWVLKGLTPLAATGVGGRQVRTEAKYGNIYDHFACTLEFPGGVKVFSACRQIGGCPSDVNDHVMGTKGQSQLMKHTIMPTGGKPWEFEGESKDMYQVEHDELFASIRAGKPINDGETAALSSGMAIFAREAAYSGQRLTWKQFIASNNSLAPKTYAFGDNPVPPVPMPGTYKFA
ncbi:MAG: Gfo/Idh/MocA family oxidoreductase [Planctomycetes bacterium]|nr:Gfo/Idh/MocA family oxidoreductase [Planctomycetota bacterium]